MSALRNLLCFFCIFALACSKQSVPPEETALEEQRATESTTGEQEPTAPATDCPELAITRDGEPFPVAEGLGFKIVAQGEVSGHQIMLTEEDINCSAVLDYDYSPTTYVMATVAAETEANSISVFDGFQAGVNLEITHYPEEVGDELAFCLREPVTLMSTSDQEYSFIGHFVGRFCGDQVFD